MFIKYMDMVISTLQIEFQYVAFITFQIILKAISIKMIIYISKV